MNNATNKKEGNKKLPKPNNIVTVPTSLGAEFFKWWCIFLRPFINLTNREIDVVSSFLKQRWELSKHISDPTILDKMVMSEDTKMKVQEECKITSQHLYVVMSNLRKNKVIINNTLNPRLIPNVRPTDNGVFQLLILFKDEKKK
jgi:hypothetical protein